MFYDLIVVGSGVLGTFHAYHAAALGKKVLLLEKDQYPSQASVRNFGQIVPSGMSAAWFEYGRRSTEVYQSIQQETDISARKLGSVYIASDQDEQQLIHELKDEMDRRGYECRLLTPAQCLEVWPAISKSYCKEALYFPQEICVEPDKMIHRVIAYALGKFSNLTYLSVNSVVDCTATNPGITVTTSSSSKFEADHVVICNGGEFRLLFSDQFKDSGIVISKLQMLRTVPLPNVHLPGNILTGLTVRRYESFTERPSFSKLKTPEHLQELGKWGIHLLFKQAVDHSIIIGDSHAYAPAIHSDDLGFSVKSHINQLMLKEAGRIVNFDVNQIAESWAGFYPQHPEKDIVEYDWDRIHIRTAIGGKGMTSGPGYSEQSIRKIFA